MAGMGARSCCCTKYTTRSYDFSGNTLWLADYFAGYDPNANSGFTVQYVTTQCIDANNVYVGGGWIGDGTNYWNIKAFDISTGALLWQRDLKADATAAVGYNYGLCEVFEINIDNNGHIVCLLSANQYTGSYGDLSVQCFVVLTASGSLVAVRQISPDGSSGVGRAAASFVVNQDGDYHYVDGYRMFDWLSPFTSAPVLRVIASPAGTGGGPMVIRRIGGRDYVGFGGALMDFSTSPQPLLWARGVVQIAAPYQLADFDLRAVYKFPDGTGNWNLCFSGGYEGDTTVRDIAVDGSGNIYIAGGVFVQGVVNDGFHWFCNKSYETIRKWNSSGVFQWAIDCDGRSIGVDGSNNIYMSGGLNGFINGTNFEKRDGTAAHIWGHHHAVGDAVDVPGAPNAIGTASTREVNVNGSTSVIRTGGGEFLHVANVGPQQVANDLSFLTSPCASVSPPGACTMAVGRSAGAFTDGAGSSYTVSFGGTPPSLGSWMVAVVWDNTQNANNIAITGGSAWTQLKSSLNFTSTPGMVMFVKRCDSSETGTYTISYAGAVGTDNSACAILEITGANQLSWLNAIVNTNAAPTGNIATLGDIVVTCMSGDTFVSSQPGSTTLQQQQNDTTVGNGTVAIATAVPTSTGTFSPGNWTMSSTASVTLWTIVFSC